MKMTTVAVLAFAVLSLPTSGRAQSDRPLRVAAASERDPDHVGMGADEES